MFWLSQVFERGVGLQEIINFAVHPSHSVREHAATCLSSIGLRTVHHSGQSSLVPYVSVSHTRILSALFSILTGGIGGQRASQKAVERAAEGVVVAACEAENRPSFLKFFEDVSFLSGPFTFRHQTKHRIQEDCALLTRMMESRSAVVQRAGCTLIRWLTYKNDTVRVVSLITNGTLVTQIRYRPNFHSVLLEARGIGCGNCSCPTGSFDPEYCSEYDHRCQRYSPN